jgi:hypothetical protein
MSDDIKQNSAPVKTSPDGQHQTATLTYDQKTKSADGQVFHHKERVTITRDGDNVAIYGEVLGDDGKTHGVQPYVSARADGVVFTNSQFTSEKQDGQGKFNGELAFSPETQAQIKALATGLLKDGKLDAKEAAAAFDATMKAPQQVIAEQMNQGKGGKGGR